MSKLSTIVTKTLATAIIAVAAASGPALAAGCAAGQCRGKQSAKDSRCSGSKSREKQASTCAAKRAATSSVFPDAGPSE